MTGKKFRQVLRWGHIVLGLAVMCYIYSPFHELQWFQIVMKFLIIPVLTISGVGIWQFKVLQRWISSPEGRGDSGAK